MATFNDMLRSGYDQSKPDKADRFCQKVIRDADNRKLYFINIYEWDNRLVGAHISLTAEVRFYSLEEEFDVSLYDCDSKTITEIEQFFSDVYAKLNCIPNIHNQ